MKNVILFQAVVRPDGLSQLPSGNVSWYANPTDVVPVVGKLQVTDPSSRLQNHPLDRRVQWSPDAFYDMFISRAGEWYLCILALFDTPPAPELKALWEYARANYAAPEATVQEDEEKAIMAGIVAYLDRLAAFTSGADQRCPQCSAAIETITLYKKIEPDMYSLYVKPCGHRLGLWRNAPNWAHVRGIVHVIPFDMSVFMNDEDEEDDEPDQ
jgi:hypothetical protein